MYEPTNKRMNEGDAKGCLQVLCTETAFVLLSLSLSLSFFLSSYFVFSSFPFLFLLLSYFLFPFSPCLFLFLLLLLFFLFSPDKRMNSLCISPFTRLFARTFILFSLPPFFPVVQSFVSCSCPLLPLLTSLFLSS